MTKKEFEDTYGENGRVKVSTYLPYYAIKGIIHYFENFNSLRKKAGEEPFTLERYIEIVLSLNQERFMIDNAKYLLEYYKEIK